MELACRVRVDASKLDHDRRHAFFPVVQVVGEVDALQARRGIDGAHGERGGAGHRGPHLSHQGEVVQLAHQRDEVALVRVQPREDAIGKVLASWLVGKVADHFERQHQFHVPVGFYHGPCVPGTAHVFGAEVGRLFQCVGHEFDGPRRR
jgi:hypothetical protein